MRHSHAFRQRERLPHCNCQALLQPCPRSPSSHLQIRHWLSSPSPGVIAELPAHPFPSPAACCWEYPAACSQLQLVPAFQKGFSPPPLPVISGWVLECLLLTASLSPHFHPLQRGTAAFGGHMLQGHSRWDAPPSAAVKD